jgi:DNA-binding CsgD family transcriptional regulator
VISTVSASVSEATWASDGADHFRALVRLPNDEPVPSVLGPSVLGPSVLGPSVLGKPSSGSNPFVGREAELGLLEESLVKARQRHPQIVAVEGVAGIGKTSLVRQFVGRAQSTALFWSSGDHDEMGLAWGVLGQLAESASAKGSPRLSDLVTDLGPYADPLVVGGGLLSLVRDNELAVVVLDDVHWADHQSLAAARFAFRRLQRGQILVIMTYRPEEAGRLGEGWRRLLVEKGARLRLAGLGIPELVRLGEAVTGSALSRRAAVKLFEQTSGHPLYARSLLEQLPVAIFERADGLLPAPADLASTVLTRLGSCPPCTAGVVRYAAVLGATCRVEDLRSVSPIAGFTDALGEAIEGGLLCEVPGSGGREVSFPHVLVRAAVYQALPPRQRREMHAAAAVALWGRASLEHRAAAFLTPDAALADEAEGYALEDASAGRTRRAVTAFKMALGLTPPGPGRRLRLLALIEALLVAGDVPGAAATAKELVALPDDPWSYYVEGFLAVLSGRVDEAQALLTRALAALQCGPLGDGAPNDLSARVSSLLAILAVVRLDHAATMHYSEEALGTTSTQDWARATAWSARLLGLTLSGRSRDALGLVEHLDQPFGPRGLDALVARGAVRLWTDDLVGAQADLTLAVEKADACQPLGVSYALGFLGQVAFGSGRLQEAVDYAELAVTMAFEADRVWELPMLHAFAAWPRAVRGEFSEAERHLAAASRRADLMGAGWAPACVSAARAHVAQARDDVPALYEAAVDFTAVYGALEPGPNVLGPVLAQALVALGQLDQAARALSDFESGVASTDRRSARASVAKVKGQLLAARGDWKGAEVQFSEAVQTYDQLAMPLGSGLAHLAWGGAALRSGKRKVGARELASARDVFEARGARAYAALADRALEKLGMSRAGPPISLGLLTPTVLTPTEEAVVRVATSGQSNAEIAQRLAVSVKTVEYHLTHVYAKLGISSRRELAARMRVAGVRQVGESADA